MKIKLILLIFLVSFFCILESVVQESGSLREFLYGEEPACEYDNYVSHIAEGIARANYNLYAPWEEQTDGFGNFRIPSEEELAGWAQVYSHYLSFELQEAEALLDSLEFPYQVVEFHDIVTDRNYLILRELVDYSYYDDNGTQTTDDDEEGAFDWSWGFYLFNPEASSPTVISAPHPNDDFITVPIALECLEALDAMFLFISGAGREVEWTEIGWYTNSKSLSDPTRNSDHPLIVSNQQAVDYIRGNFEREFALQVHSYDWNRHANYANTQFSVVHSNPNLPLRDLSGLHNDLINHADHLMVPAGEFGNHADSWLNDYFAVYYTHYPFEYVSEDTTFIVNNNIDLPGVGGDFLYYVIEGRNPYDVYDPFMHMEMDELPNEFVQNTTEYYEFYGFDEGSGNWSFEDRYTKAMGWYSRWIYDLAEALPDAIELDDGFIPAAPESIWFENIDSSSLLVNWIPEPAYDHYSYTVFIDTMAIDPDNSESFDRNTNQYLASSLHDNLQIDGLELDEHYHVMIAVEDYAGNITYSDEEITITAPAYVEDFAEFGGDAQVDLHWIAEEQSSNMGFKVYRHNGDDFVEIASWETNPELISDNTNGQFFSFSDYDVLNFNYYEYKISMENTEGLEYMVDDIVEAIPHPVYQLSFIYDAETSSDIEFSWNTNATNYYDEYYDEPCFSYQDEDLYSAVYQPSWSHIWLAREIKSSYNPVSNWRSWDVEVRSQFPESSLLVEISDNYPEAYRLYLLNKDTGEMRFMHDEEETYIQLDDDGEASLRLFAGNLIPEIELDEEENSLYQPGDIFVLDYEAEHTQLIEYYSVVLYNQNGFITIQDSTAGELPDQIEWTVPDTINAQNLNPRIYYTSDMGITYHADGDYVIGIVPSELSYELTAGWYNFSNFGVEDPLVPGMNAALYSYTDSSYIEETIAEFGEGYWLEVFEDFVYTAGNPYQTAQWQTDLETGWNLLPNPFPAQLSIEGLNFEYFGITRDFRYMVEHGYLSYNAFAYRDSLFVPVLEVFPGESFYIYNHMLDTYDVDVVMIPSNTGTPLPPITENFKAGVSVSQGMDNDLCWLGAAGNSTDEFDVIYDFPALPAKPLGHGCRIAVEAPSIMYPEPDFQTIFMGSFWGDPVKEHQLNISGQPSEDITLSFIKNYLPVEYFFWLEIDGDIFDSDLIDNLTFEMSETGSISASAFVEYPRNWDYGNIDKNTGVEALDAALVLQYSVGLNPEPIAPLPWQEWRLITADVDENSEIGSYDASLILQYCVGMITEFPVESRIPSPEGNISIVLENNELNIYSLGNFYSLDLSIDFNIEGTQVSSQVLSAINKENAFKLGIASSKPMIAGEFIAGLTLGDNQKIPEEIDVCINGERQRVEINREEVPYITSLNPIYPNPFNINKMRGLSIAFSLQEQSAAKFSVYNIKGQKVKTFREAVYEKGNHTISWDFSNDSGKMTSSGIYFIKMTADNYQKTRKLILIK